MYCKKCGTEIDNDSTFCSSCGTKQNQVVSTQTVQDSVKDIQAKVVNVNLSFGRTSVDKGKTYTNVQTDKYDRTYMKETDATIFGVILLALSILGVVLISNSTLPSIAAPFISIFGFILRIIATVWTVKIAGNQNREPLGWGIFSFIFPSFALIIIGQSNKIKDTNTKTESQNNIANNSINTQTTTESEFLGSGAYWLVLFGIPILILLVIFIFNQLN